MDPVKTILNGTCTFSYTQYIDAFYYFKLLIFFIFFTWKRNMFRNRNKSISHTDVNIQHPNWLNQCSLVCKRTFRHTQCWCFSSLYLKNLLLQNLHNKSLNVSSNMSLEKSLLVGARTCDACEETTFPDTRKCQTLCQDSNSCYSYIHHILKKPCVTLEHKPSYQIN